MFELDFGEIEEAVLFFAFGLWEGHTHSTLVLLVFLYSSCFIQCGVG